MKRFILLAIVIVFILSLSACGVGIQGSGVVGGKPNFINPVIYPTEGEGKATVGYIYVFPVENQTCVALVMVNSYGGAGLDCFEKEQ
jgi:hypothetical protein